MHYTTSINVATMFIPKTVAGIIKRRSCVCNSEACIEITSLFAALGDIRGQYKKLPNPISDSRKGIVKAVLDKWDERCCIHLRINITKFRESICYNKTFTVCTWVWKKPHELATFVQFNYQQHIVKMRLVIFLELL